MITIALHKDLWVAYDATDGSLYQAWQGGVEFDGAVYTTRHGPQPTSEGTPLVRTAQYPVGPWTVKGNTPTVRYLGYTRDGDESVEIRTRLSTRSGGSVVIHEIPSVRTADDGSVQLVRTFRVEGESRDEVTVWVEYRTPEGHPIQLDAPNKSILVRAAFGNGNDNTEKPDSTTTDRFFGVKLSPDQPTTITYTFNTPEARP